MMDNVWKRISNKRPKGAKLVKCVGVGSAGIWILALGCMFMFRNKALPKQMVDAAKAGVDSLKAYGGAPNSEEKTPAAPAVEAKLTVDMPTRAEWSALKQLAELYDQSGDLEKAVVPLRRVLVMPSRDADLLMLATRVYLGTANYQEALETARQALALRPKDIGLKVETIECEYRLGNVAKALAESGAALKDQPDDLSLLLEQATMEVELGPSHAGYGLALQTALKLNPKWVPALYLSGRKAQLEGNFRDAEAYFRKVLAADASNAKAHAQLGMALYHQEKITESVPEFRHALALSPRDYNSWFNLGEAQLSEADQAMAPGKIQSARAEAMESYLQALEIYPDHAQAHYRVGVLLNGNGQYKEAIRHLQAALKIDSHHVPTLIQLALAFESLRQPERAREYLSKAYELDPLNKVVLFRLKRWS